MFDKFATGGNALVNGAKAAQDMLTRTLAIEWARARRNGICLALHPGTTDTDRSRPLQANVPADRLFVTERSVRQLLGSIDRLQHTESHRFCGCDGESIPW
jgi:NAD(P)-dependent dehydrogenase (short-subunit alcohol dehydrogenase family)